MKLAVVTLSLLSSFAMAISFANTAKMALTDMEQNNAVIIDVRENKEVATGRVKGALAFPNSKLGTREFETFVASLPKEKTIYTYCARGRRAGIFAEELKKRGYKVENAGGIEDLKKAGAVTQ